MNAKERRTVDEAIIAYGAKCHRLGVRAAKPFRRGEVKTEQLEREARNSRAVISAMLDEYAAGVEYEIAG